MGGPRGCKWQWNDCVRLFWNNKTFNIIWVFAYKSEFMFCWVFSHKHKIKIWSDLYNGEWSRDWISEDQKYDQEIKSLIRRSKVFMIRRLNFFPIFQEIERFEALFRLSISWKIC
jgi:hypothetical protein